MGSFQMAKARVLARHVVFNLTLMSKLLAGWSEHIGPNGHPYYYNSATKESTYVRPSLPAKKEKPSHKTSIPGHPDWLRVKTTEGNTFYFNKEKKESIWVVPDEIKDAVEQMDSIDDEQMMEVERVKSEVEDAVKRKAESGGDSKIAKKRKLESESEEEEEQEQEDWEQEAAAQLLEEAKRLEEAKKSEEARIAELAKRAVPQRADLSVEEGKALFKNLLREKDVNPLHPWDTSLPLFVSDPRYLLLPSLSARREAFDEYCRERSREIREVNIRKEKSAVNPKEEFDRLLSTEVKSTRASWSDFRRTWKKDRRFYGWGRDDREREKRFKEYLKDLGDKKKAAAQKAEADFFALLKDHDVAEKRPVWKEFKNSLSNDPRYDAVGSSSLREELFNVFLKGTAAVSQSVSTVPETSNEIVETKQERKERAVKEREEKVRAERERLEASIGQSRNQLTQGEEEAQFMTMLTDAVRDPQITWEKVLPQLKTDPRFSNSSLPLNQQMHLFHVHAGRLRLNQFEGLYSLFEMHAPSLSAVFSDIPVPSLLSSIPVKKLGLNVHELEREFSKWQRERTQNARTAFDQMMTENSFIEFWGRLGKLGGEGVDGGVKAEDMGEDEGEGGGGRVDMKALAKSVDVSDMQKVLKNDKRYTIFDHVPEQRERWIRDYISRLEPPKLSVHVD